MDKLHTYIRHFPDVLPVRLLSCLLLTATGAGTFILLFLFSPSVYMHLSPYPPFPPYLSLRADALLFPHIHLPPTPPLSTALTLLLAFLFLPPLSLNIEASPSFSVPRWSRQKPQLSPHALDNSFLYRSPFHSPSVFPSPWDLRSQAECRCRP